MEIDITKLDETELKALAFDISQQMTVLQRNYNIVLQQLQVVKNIENEAIFEEASS